MNIWKSRKFRIAVAVLGVLLAVQVTTYLWHARAIMPRSALRQLSDYKGSPPNPLIVVEGQRLRPAVKTGHASRIATKQTDSLFVRY